MHNIDCRTLIDHQQYPIADNGNAKRREVIEQVQASLAEDGCAVLKGFLSLEGLQTILEEALDRCPKAYFSDQTRTNVYLSKPDETFPDDHPVNHMMDRTNGFITADNFDESTIAQQLYYWPPLGEFLAECLGKNKLHIYADPVSNMIVNVGKPGTQFCWHYDTNEFTITMLLKAAPSGGHFEYAPNIRNANDECHEDVSALLNGDRCNVKRLELKPGDLQFFLGRYSLHRVTENTGDDDRLLIIMSFTDQPNLIGNKERVQQLYGKLTDAHHQERVRNDNLMD